MKNEPTLANKIATAELAEQFQGLLDEWRQLDPSFRGAVLAAMLEKHRTYMGFAETTSGLPWDMLRHPEKLVGDPDDGGDDVMAQVVRQVQIAKAFEVAGKLLVCVRALTITSKEAP